MISYQRTLIIDASPDAVWQVLSRFMHIDEIAPMVTSVEELTTGPDQVGSKRRCHFQDGNSMAEEVVEWNEGRGYRVRLSETDPMPLKEGYASIRITPEVNGRSRVDWGMDYRVKYGPLGWLLGQTMMKMMMGKVLDGNLKALAEKAKAARAAA
jgi:carbon monoxide dehydrogenase subunit G